ncbi:PA0069 family radical SAM protein [Aquimarina sp. 2201CG5-10]|uniref:PA0069 family radical SAM protein n=1 Tax=Aquimarina callyspongiae TaxID=3098150 RepID=UPI002AB55287|nr:PA0069 family radical SAM protein [Aquimarina sp. 2201CG5-10]MDY8137034.1 PA0069 family radical SAM protein [Aquimarina sp. 2201CG5-10]
MEPKKHIKGRGAQGKIHNKFFENHYETRNDFLNYCHAQGEDSHQNQTTYIETFPKTVVNKVTSPDVGMMFSLNPYQGCEHGCVYCYARNSHEYWGYGAGLDFESKILVKKNAPELLEKKLKSKNWKAHPISLSGNTDCYQPIEKKLKITRQLLQVFLKYKHPVGIITKNALIQRDLDILTKLSKDNLVAVFLSITSLQEETRRILEPRTASIKKRLETVEKLNQAGIPVGVMMAPIIPSINSHEILSLSKEVAKRGAHSIGYTVVRLNGAIGQIFTKWLEHTLPDRKDKILHQIKECHEGKLNDNHFGRRMSGSGNLAEQIHQLFALARKKYFPERKKIELNCNLHESYKDGQLRLF